MSYYSTRNIRDGIRIEIMILVWEKCAISLNQISFCQSRHYLILSSLWWILFIRKLPQHIVFMVCVSPHTNILHTPVHMRCVWQVTVTHKSALIHPSNWSYDFQVILCGSISEFFVIPCWTHCPVQKKSFSLQNYRKWNLMIEQFSNKRR